MSLTSQAAAGPGSALGRAASADGMPPSVTIRFDGAVPVLEVPPLPSFEELRGWLRECLPEQAEVIGGRASRLDLGEREIKLFDLRRLIHFLREEHAIEITGLYVRPDAIQRFAERELKLKLFAVEARPPEPEPEPEPTTELQPEDLVLDDVEAEPVVEEAAPEPEVAKLQAAPLPHDLEPEDLDPDAKIERRDDGRRTLTLKKTLRSGAVVRFDGDLYVFGDVNPGAQVIATGNITVLGALKGMAHAGAAGDESSFILAFQLKPTQLRISRRIAIAPERAEPGAAFQPEMASAVDGQIVIEAYKGRLR